MAAAGGAGCVVVQAEDASELGTQWGLCTHRPVVLLTQSRLRGLHRAYLSPPLHAEQPLVREGDRLI